jgi:hypothetical protein
MNSSNVQISIGTRRTIPIYHENVNQWISLLISTEKKVCNSEFDCKVNKICSRIVSNRNQTRILLNNSFWESLLITWVQCLNDKYSNTNQLKKWFITSSQSSTRTNIVTQINSHVQKEKLPQQTLKIKIKKHFNQCTKDHHHIHTHSIIMLTILTSIVLLLIRVLRLIAISSE